MSLFSFQPVLHGWCNWYVLSCLMTLILLPKPSVLYWVILCTLCFELTLILGLGTSISVSSEHKVHKITQYNTLGLGTSISVSSEHKVHKITQYNTLGLGTSISVSSKHKVHKISQYNTLGLGRSISVSSEHKVHVDHPIQHTGFRY